MSACVWFCLLTDENSAAAELAHSKTSPKGSSHAARKVSEGRGAVPGSVARPFWLPVRPQDQ